jgi:hypothetical protein
MNKGIGRIPANVNVMPARDSVTRVDELIHRFAQHNLRLSYRRYGLSRGVKLDLRINTCNVGDMVYWPEVEKIIKSAFPKIRDELSWKGRYIVLIMYEEFL